MTKYNSKKTVIDGHTFDSKAEGEYYSFLVEQKQIGLISDFILQPKFTLQDGFKKDDKYYKPIMYVADFLVVYPNGRMQVIDVKGFETADFKIKRKLFEKKYPYPLTLVKYVKKFGGWIELDEWKRRKKEEKKK